MAFGSISVDRIVDSEGSVFSPSSVSFRNRIINGDMRIDQRNAGAAVTPTVDGRYGSCDRWSYFISQASKFSVQQSSTAPTGFSNSLLATSLSAYAVTGNDYFGVLQKIEGFNFADLLWGTANAKTITVSFWVRSSLTGTFGGAMTNSAYNRSYPFNYTVNAANTWEQKTVTISGDTTGTWVGSTNGIGAVVQFSLGAVSGKLGTAGSWSGNWYIGSTGSTSVVGTNGATFYITGVQLEVGSVATPFERRPYGTELSLCQRYCFVVRGDLDQATGFVGYSETTSAARFGVRFPTSMRSSPSFALSGTCRCQGGTTDGADFTSGLVITGTAAGSYDGAALRVTGTSNLGAADRGFNLQIRANGTTLTFSAEL